MVRILLIRSAATYFDEQGRIKVTLDLPLSDHGLWHGKLVDELKHSQPRVYRQLQDHPETVCPPEGEPVGMAQARVRVGLDRLLRKHRSGTVALVVPEPLYSLVQQTLTHDEL